MYDGIFDGSEQPRCQKRMTAPSARVTCTDNAADLELSSHRQAQAATWPQASHDDHAQYRKHKGANVDSLSTSDKSDSTGQPKKRLKGKVVSLLNNVIFDVSYDIARQRSFCDLCAGTNSAPQTTPHCWPICWPICGAIGPG